MKNLDRLVMATLLLVGSSLASSGLYAQQIELEFEMQPNETPSVQTITVGPEFAQALELDPEILDQIVLLLSGYHYFPTAEDLLAVTPDPAPYLLAIAYNLDGTWLPSHANRAVNALSLVPNETVHQQLVYLLSDDSGHPMRRHHVITALARGFAEACLEELRPLLEDGDLQIRMTAVSALGLIPTQRALETLQLRLEFETEELVRQHIEQALTTENLPPGFGGPHIH